MPTSPAPGGKISDMLEVLTVLGQARDAGTDGSPRNELPAQTRPVDVLVFSLKASGARQGFQPWEQRFQVLIDGGEQNFVINTEIAVDDTVSDCGQGGPGDIRIGRL